MTLRYLSLFSGIEAATVAWKQLGFQPVTFAEIEPFPCAALTHHYPNVLNLGDVVDLRDRLLSGDDVANLLSNPPDIVVGGSPCQAWSVAGLRKGLSDKRGQLTLVYAEIINAIHPRFIVWENVPGVLSAKDNGFGHLLGALAGEDEPLEPPGKKWTNAGVVSGPERNLAWRVLDAQYFGVPQRRRRVFLVGCSAASGRDPSEILFERQGVPGDSAPRGKTRKDVAPTLGERAHGGGFAPGTGGLGTDFGLDGGLIPSVSPCLTSNYGKQPDNSDTNRGPMLIVSAITANGVGTCGADDNQAQAGHLIPLAFGGNNTVGPISVATAVNACSTASGRQDFESETFIVHPADPIAFDCKAGGNTSFSIGGKPGSMRGEGHGGGHLAIAFQPGNLRRGAGAKPSKQSFPTLKADHGRGMSDQHPHIAHTLRAEGFDASEDGTGRGIPLVPVYRVSWAVRRLTPVECARLQGFPDDYLNISYHGKPAADGNQYKALGNSMAVPVMKWIGKRILPS